MGIYTLQTPKVKEFLKKRGITRDSDTRDSESQDSESRDSDTQDSDTLDSDTRDSESRGVCEKTGASTEIRHSRIQKSAVSQFLKKKYQYLRGTL